MSLVLRVLFTLYFVLSTAFVKLVVGIPLKDAVLVMIFVILFTVFNRQTSEFFKEHAGLVIVFISFTILGFSITLLNNASVGTAFESFLRFIVQPFLTVSCTYVLARLLGLRFVAALLIGSAMTTGFFALLQGVNVTPGWELRKWIGSLQNEPLHTAESVGNALRPPGISLTPIIFAFHVISAYTALQFFHKEGLIGRKWYNISVAVLLLMALANATRSLMIGLLVQEILFQLYRLQQEDVFSRHWFVYRNEPGSGVFRNAGIQGDRI